NLCVRSHVNDLLREIVCDTRDVTYFFLDGRDMGSVVFMDADLKIFLTASLDVRAERRFKQRSSGESFEEVKNKLAKRDKEDRSRQVGALVEPEGCWLLVSSDLSLEETVRKILDRLKQERDPISPRFSDADQ
ncbi:(d)CMP kinase, partial [Candidatus Similichlamydia epinepheli]|uniref:(d)CMP kinase n=1 Tax=Candidatus Similichlamydia epinepheli TaxID=1903953 RepID=UPI001863C254